MIYRVVRMVFTEETKKPFADIFYQKKEYIEAMPGCVKVDLVQDSRDSTAMGTISIWDREEDLEAYRQSELFIDTWKEVKLLFAGKAKAWTYEIM